MLEEFMKVFSWHEKFSAHAKRIRRMLSNKFSSERYIMKYHRKGHLTESETSGLLIVDESNKAYKVDEHVKRVWDMCDGDRTKEQIIDGIINQERIRIHRAVSEILVKLQGAGLVDSLE